MKSKLIVLGILVATCASASKEVILSRVYIQRRDQTEFNWGAQNDVGEVTYSVNNDGSVSLYVGTEEGTRKVVDTDTVSVAKVNKLDPSEYIIYAENTEDATKPIIMSSENVFSIWNYIEGGVTNDQWKSGLATNPRYLHVQSLNDNIKITSIECEIVNKPPPQHEGGLPVIRHGTSMSDDYDGKPEVSHTLKFTSGYSGVGSDLPPSCIVSNFVVYGTIGSLGNAVIDSSNIDIKVLERDGRSYSLGRFHNILESTHRIQDRWSYYSAKTDVKLGYNAIKFGTKNRLYGSGNSIKFDSVLGTIVEYNGGVGEGWFVDDINICTTNDTVELLVDSSINQQVVLKRKNELTDANWTVLTPGTDYTDSYPSTVEIDGIRYYKLTVPMLPNKNSGFYTLSVTPQDPYIKLNADRIFVGSESVEYNKVQITDKDGVVWEVLGRRISP